MRFTTVAVITLMLILAGCSTTQPVATETSAPSPTALPGSVSGSFFAIHEVGLGSGGYVALTNFTDQPARLGGLFLCQGAQCFELPDAEVAAGATVRIAVGDGAGLDQVVATKATIGELRPADGEIGLYTSQDVSDPQAILKYVQWGSTPHDNTRVAIEAGLWSEGGFAPSSEKATRIFRDDSGLWLFDEK